MNVTHSVIVPAWNRGYIIRDAIGSVLDQTCGGDLEVLIVDDGSTDDTASIVEQVRDPRIRFFRHERNRGCSAAYNTGLREARGELISFLDSDDMWARRKLEAETQFLLRHPEADAVFSDLAKEDGAAFVPSFMRESPHFARLLHDKGYPREIVFGRREIELCLLREVPIKPTTLTVRREALLQTGFFNESWPSGSDWELLLRFARFYRFGYLDERLGTIRVQSDATHRAYAVADNSLMLKLLESYMRDAGDDLEMANAARCGYTDVAKHLAWAYLNGGCEMAAARTLGRAAWAVKDARLLARSVFSLLPAPLRRSFHGWRTIAPPVSAIKRA